MQTSLIRAALVSLLWAGATSAQDDDRLAQAEQAYLAVDFPRALALSEQALESGAYGPAELERLYRLMGLAASAEGESERAVEAYVRMFALNPEAQPDEGLSPRLRQTFMEAAGRWSARRTTMALRARRLRGNGGVGLSVEDPLSMIDHVVVYRRIAGSGDEFVETQIDPRRELAVPIDGLDAGDSIELHARAVDVHGNRVMELGSPYEPVLLEGETQVEESPGTEAVPTTAPAEPTERDGGGISPWFFGIGAALTVVAGGVLAWSSYDVSSSHDDYLADPTLEKYYEGLDLQTRTNVLIVVTSAVGAATALLAIFTDWGDDDDDEPTSRLGWDVFASPSGARAVVGGAF